MKFGMTNKRTSWSLVAIVCVLGLMLSGRVARGGQQDQIEMIGTREGTRWVVPLASSGTTKIPRVCASLRAAYFEGHPDKNVTVHPEVEYWEIRIKGQPLSERVILEFDEEPATLEEIEPIRQLGDGTLTLRCGLGKTTGEKLRFEPQPHKNTIGYWAVQGDSVSWPIHVTKPGEFNVGLLQGAGGVGGGVARVSLVANGQTIGSFEYEVLVTGHFQNFVWRHGGSLNVEEPGQYELKIEAIKINKVALMDVRQVHLSPKR